jgi:hypothetical protein
MMKELTPSMMSSSESFIPEWAVKRWGRVGGGKSLEGFEGYIYMHFFFFCNSGA